jgi:hypothetical protein
MEAMMASARVTWPWRSARGPQTCSGHQACCQSQKPGDLLDSVPSPEAPGPSMQPGAATPALPGTTMPAHHGAVVLEA